MLNLLGLYTVILMENTKWTTGCDLNSAHIPGNLAYLEHKLNVVWYTIMRLSNTYAYTCLYIVIKFKAASVCLLSIYVGLHFLRILLFLIPAYSYCSSKGCWKKMFSSYNKTCDWHSNSFYCISSYLGHVTKKSAGSKLLFASEKYSDLRGLNSYIMFLYIWLMHVHWLKNL